MKHMKNESIKYKEGKAKKNKTSPFSIHIQMI